MPGSLELAMQFAAGKIPGSHEPFDISGGDPGAVPGKGKTIDGSFLDCEAFHQSQVASVPEADKSVRACRGQCLPVRREHAVLQVVITCLDRCELVPGCRV